MNNKLSKKVFIFYIVAMLFVFIITAGGCFLDTPFSRTEYDYSFIVKGNAKNESFYKSWQDYVKDDVLLKDIIIPGTHDTMTDGMIGVAKTQEYFLYDQACGGSRYFDLRVTKKNGKLVAFHGPIKGVEFEPLIKDLRKFMDENPTQFFILNFQHFGTNMSQEVYSILEKTLDMSKMINKDVYKNVETITIGEVRNKYNGIIIWGEEENLDNKYLYDPEYLYSPYDGDYHKDQINVLLDHYNDYYENFDGKTFFVLQAQRTAPSLKVWEKPYLLEVEYRPIINEYINDLNLDNSKLIKTNIIMRDFLLNDMRNVNIILKLNISKQTIKIEKIEEFNNIVNALN